MNEVTFKYWHMKAITSINIDTWRQLHLTEPALESYEVHLHVTVGNEIPRPLLNDRAFTYRMLLFVGCLTSQQHASVSQGRICSDKLSRCVCVCVSVCLSSLVCVVGYFYVR